MLKSILKSNSSSLRRAKPRGNLLEKLRSPHPLQGFAMTMSGGLSLEDAWVPRYEGVRGNPHFTAAFASVDCHKQPCVPLGYFRVGRACAHIIKSNVNSS